MSDYVIFTDSSADLNEAMCQQLQVQVQCLSFNLDGETYKDSPDAAELNPHDFYEKLRAGGSSSTSQINASAFKEVFIPCLEAGQDILYLGFSSGLSGTFNGGRMAAEELASLYPDRRLVVVDTLAASLGQGLLVWYAAKMKKEGKSLTEVAEWVEANKLKLAHWFTVDDLNFLKRGGRLSAGAAMLGTMLNIKPVMHVDNEGHLVPMHKVRGRQKSLMALVDEMEKTAITPGEQTVFISHGDCLDDAQLVADEIKRRFGTKDFFINFVGPVIGSHAGPGVVALFFMAIER